MIDVELRTPQALGLGAASAAIVVYVYASILIVNGWWSAINQAMGLAPVLLMPLAGMAAAWRSGRDRAVGLRELVATAPRRGEATWMAMAATMLAATAGAMVGLVAASVHLMLAGPTYGAPSAAFLLLCLSTIPLSVGVGHVLGLAGDRRVTAPLAAIVLYVPGAYAFALPPGVQSHLPFVEATLLPWQHLNVARAVAIGSGYALAGLALAALITMVVGRRLPALILAVLAAAAAPVAFAAAPADVTWTTTSNDDVACLDRPVRLCVHRSLLASSPSLLDEDVAGPYQALARVPDAPRRILVGVNSVGWADGDLRVGVSIINSRIDVDDTVLSMAAWAVASTPCTSQADAELREMAGWVAFVDPDLLARHLPEVPGMQRRDLLEGLLSVRTHVRATVLDRFDAIAQCDPSAINEVRDALPTG